MNYAEIFENYNCIAVVGMSDNPIKPAHSVPAYMMSQGFYIIPVNPNHDKILHLKTYACITDIPDYIDIVNIFRPSESCYEIIEKAVKRHNEKGDINLIWLQEGIFCDEGKKLAEENGIQFIQNVCIYKEFVNLD